MQDLPQINFSLAQIYPGTGSRELNTCNNPDCLNFGEAYATSTDRLAQLAVSHPHLAPEELRLLKVHGPGAYRMQGSDDSH